MTELVKYSCGDTRVSLRTHIAVELMRAMHKELINVPVSMTTNELMFEFKSTWDRVVKKEISDDALIDVIKMLLDMWEAMGIGQTGSIDSSGRRTYTYDEAVLADVATRTGERKETIQFVFTLLEKFISQNLAGQMLTPTLMKTALNAGIPHVNKLITVGLTDVQRVKGIFNHFFALFTMHAPWADINQYVKDTISKDPLIVMCKHFIDVFKDTGTMHVPMRLSAAYNQLDWASLGVQPIFEISKTSLPLVERLKAVNLPSVNVFGIWDWFWSYLRIHMGGPAYMSSRYTQLQFERALQSGQFLWPAMPADWLDGVNYTSWRRSALKAVPAEVDKLFNQLFYLYLLRNAQRTMAGMYRAPFETLMMQKEYKKQDAVTETFTREWLDPLCLCLQCMDTVAVDIVKFSKSPILVHQGLLPHEYDKWMAFTDVMMSHYKDMYLDQAHPRYFMQGALLISQLQSGNPDITILNKGDELPSFHFYDSAYDSTGDFIYDVSAQEYARYGKTAIYSSTIINAPIPETRIELLTRPIASSIQPFYSMDFPIESPYADLHTIEFRLRAVSEVMVTKNGWNHFLESRLETLYYFTPEAMARELRIPLTLAKTLWPGADRCYRQFTGPLVKILVWDPEVLPVYECNFADSVIEGGRYAPFVALWPFAVKFTRPSFARTVGGRKPNVIQVVNEENTVKKASVPNVQAAEESRAEATNSKQTPEATAAAAAEKLNATASPTAAAGTGDDGATADNGDDKEKM